VCVCVCVCVHPLACLAVEECIAGGVVGRTATPQPEGEDCGQRQGRLLLLRPRYGSGGGGAQVSVLDRPVALVGARGLNILSAAPHVKQAAVAGFTLGRWGLRPTRFAPATRATKAGS
jgi:hypothetical protein